MPNPVGRFVWYDLMTTDVKAAETFYSSVVGWDAKDSGMPDRTYSLLSMGSIMVGGLMPIPDNLRETGAQPVWMGYIGVDNVDAYADRVQAAGGAIHRAPEDIPTVGRFAVVADPHGAVFILFSGTGDPQILPQNTLGIVGWNELYAGDLDSAWAFYSSLFGWTKAMAVDMGPMGTYQTFMTCPEQGGGIMTKPPNVPAPYWGYYFTVEGVEAAMDRVKERGGTLLRGPHQVPGGAWIANCLDPQGAFFSLTSMNK